MLHYYWKTVKIITTSFACGCTLIKCIRNKSYQVSFSFARPARQKIKGKENLIVFLLKPFQPSVNFRTETSHLFCRVKQWTELSEI